MIRHAWLPTVGLAVALSGAVAHTQGGAASMPSPVEDVARLSASTTNDERFEALTAMLRARKLEFTVETFALDKPMGREPRTEGRNVVVTMGDGARDVVVGAHYDAVRLQDGSLAKGAVDNAASSVMLVRLAEALQAESLPVRLRLVWFDMEELGLIGSRRFVQQHAADRIAAMINFDINGYGDTILFGPVLPANAAVRRSFLETCAAQDIACVAFPQMPPGDDRSFVKAGVPTVSVALLPAIELHQLWLMLNGGPNAGLAKETVPAILKTIHTPEDTPEKVSEQSLALVLRFAQALVRSLARS
jgi:Peptidase family M28